MRVASCLDQWPRWEPPTTLLWHWTFSLELVYQACAYLRAFERMSEACSVEIPLTNSHNLRLALKTPKRRRVDDPRAIALVG
jgi:hypothetical protein